MSVCKPVCKSARKAHTQTKNLAASKFVLRILERFFEKTAERFF